MSKNFKQLAKAAVAIPGMVATAHASAPSDIEVAYRYSSYTEDDSPSSRDDSGGAQPRYDITVNQFHILVPVGSDLAVSLESSYESMSGASPVYSYIPDGDEDVYTHFAGASKEARFDANANVRKYFSTAEVGTGVYVSKERDYLAVNGSLDGSFQINDQMTTLSGGVSFGYDWLNPTVVDTEGNVTNGNDLSDTEAEELLTINPAVYGAIDQTKWQLSMFQGVGQIINMNTVVQASASYTYKSGYLSDPYRNCVGSNESIAENVPCDIRPSDRSAGTLSFGVRRFIPGLDSAVHVDYRLYLDSWDILSNTVDFAYYQNYVPGWSFFTRYNVAFQVIPSLRYYHQTAAYFYEIPDLNTTSGWAYTADTTEYYSSDPRLSKYGAISTKLTAKIDIKSVSIVGGVERYTSNPKLGFSDEETARVTIILAFYNRLGLLLLKEQTLQFFFKGMGGPCQLTLVSANPRKAQYIHQRIQKEVLRLEKKFSRFQKDSLLSQLNRGELNGVKLDSETQGLLNYVSQCFDASGSLFDPTVGILKTVWNFSAKIPPKREQVREFKSRIGWQKVKWDGESLQMPENMSLDLGGLVKEFAVDRARAILEEEQTAGLVNFAGDLAVNGLSESGQDWKIAIQHPRQVGAIATIGLKQGAIAGSGDYERYLDYQGERYCHLLRPDTGFPAKDGLISVTVLAENCLLAGTISTVAMLKGEEGIDWLEDMAMPYLAIDQTLKFYGSIEVIK